MPPVTPRPGGRLRYTVTAVALAAITLGAIAFIQLGRFLAREDPLAKADAIFVLAGTRMERPLEAADLYLAGYAPRLVLTYERPDQAVVTLNQRGIAVPADADLSRDLLIRVGVPPEAIVIPPHIHDNTAAEAQTLRELAVRNHWRRVIVVTSKYHLRRAGFAMNRELERTGVEVFMRGSRYDPSNPSRWWMSRSDARWMVGEVPKLIAYLLGLGA